jgi:hypothetical protein
MSLLVAVPCGVAAAIAYGTASAVQHDAAHTGTGSADALGLLRLLRDPRWLLSMGADTVGLVLQVIALSTGPVVLIQPLLVLALPVSMLAGWALGGPGPRRAEYLACASILGGLALFFALVGNPGKSAPLSAHAAMTAVLVALVAGLAACLAVRGRSVSLRAAVYGGVAGSWFGVVSVLLNATATTWRDHGLAGFSGPGGLVPLVALIVLGGMGVALTQISFQVGALGSSFPANKAADPVVAVVLGSVLLHERLPAGPGYVLGYLACLAAIVAGTIRLANPVAPSASVLASQETSP